jgi:uncharacterized protein
MRRTDREITDRSEIDDIIRQCQVCRLGLTDGVEPYVVPLSFGYDGRALYFHCAREGRKLDILRKNSRVCFEFDILDGLVTGDAACQWGMAYRSVIGAGQGHIIEGSDEKCQALAILMKQYADAAFTFPDAAVDSVAIIRVDISSISGKQRSRT